MADKTGKVEQVQKIQQVPDKVFKKLFKTVIQNQYLCHHPLMYMQVYSLVWFLPIMTKCIHINKCFDVKKHHNLNVTLLQYQPPMQLIALHQTCILSMITALHYIYTYV